MPMIERGYDDAHNMKAPSNVQSPPRNVGDLDESSAMNAAHEVMMAARELADDIARLTTHILGATPTPVSDKKAQSSNGVLDYLKQDAVETYGVILGAMVDIKRIRDNF